MTDIQLPLSLRIVVTSKYLNLAKANEINTCADLSIGIAQAGLIASASTWIVLSYPPLLAVFYIITKYYVRTARQMKRLDLEEKAPL